MANKQFIRHLEFYGYPDQNVYTSESCCGSVDLSEIIAKNKQQDREIKCLTHEKADKKDLDALSATVETVISAQTDINIGFANAISGLSDDIDAIKETDTQFAEQLSAMTDTINEVSSGLSDAICGIQILANEIDGLSGAVDDLKDTLENDYAKKDEVVTREWIEEQGYLTVESGDSRYAKIEDLDDLAVVISSLTESVDDEIDEINEKIDDLSGKVETEIEEINDKIDEFSGEVTTEIEEINDKIDEFSGEVTTELEEINGEIDELQETVSGITDDIAELQEEVSGNTEDIAELQEEVSAITEDIEDLTEQVDANTEDIAELQDEVSGITEDIEDIKEELATKASQRDLDDTRRELQGEIDDLEANKADKTDLQFVSGAVDDLSDRLDAEIQRSTDVDTAMQAAIDSLSGDVESLSDKVDEFDDRMTAVENGLAQEIIDREQAIIDLIGTSGDSRDADTIWGAKNYAKSVKQDAVDEANDYTDQQVAHFEGELMNLSAATDQKLSRYATEEYVISACQDTEAELRGELGGKIDNEIERAERAEGNLEVEIQALSGVVETNAAAIDYNATRLNAITAWPGTDPSQYDDSGNGILDVLHREFHELEEEIGHISNPTLQKSNKYEVAFGEYNQTHTGESDAEKTMFSIGNGTGDSNRSNAIEIRKDGTVYMWIEGEYMPINNLLGMLAHEIY